MPTTRPKGEHGVQNCRYVRHGLVDATAADLLYITNLTYTKNVSEQPLYADNRMQMKIKTDNPETGTATFTSEDVDFEVAMGVRMPAANGGYLKVRAVGDRRFDLFFSPTYENEDTGEIVPVGVKVCLLNVSFAEGGKTHATDAESVTFAETAYNFTVYGTDALVAGESGGDPVPYMDNNGIGRTVWCMYSFPDDEGYDEFDTKAPVPLVNPDAIA